MDINVCRMQQDRLVHYIIRLWGKFYGTSFKSASHFECFSTGIEFLSWQGILLNKLFRCTRLVCSNKSSKIGCIILFSAKVEFEIYYYSNIKQVYRNIPIFGRIIFIQFPILARSIRSPTIYQEGHTYMINKSLNAVNLVNVTI